MLVQKDTMSGVARIKWYKYRYLVVAGLLANILLINYFFFDTSVSRLSAFGDTFIDHGYDPFEMTSPPQSSRAPMPQPPYPPSKVDKPSKPTVPVIKPGPPVIPPPPADPALFNLNDLDFNGKYIGWPLERVCNETKNQPGLVFICDNNSGGIGNIRNFILTCVRYAIDAGATGIILPKIQRRSEADLANIFTTSLQPFDYFFDEEHFRWALGTHCPRMAIYNTTEDIPNSQNKTAIKEFYPKDLNNPDGGDTRGRNRHLDMYRTKFDRWLSGTNRAPKLEKPVTIRFKWATFFEWSTYRDGPEFTATFGDILRIRKDIADLAAVLLAEMSKFAGFDPSAQETPRLSAPFLGVHLRSESDALDFWPDFHTQTRGYLEVANNTNLKHAYLACGNATESHRFAEEAWSHLRLNVTSKLDLLKGNDLKRLQALSWDQQALVDFLVLSKSTHFTGCSFSSFTMNIAFKRHLMTGGIMTRQWQSPGDAYSTLVGRFDKWWGDWMFMYECMWP
jgi:GDP-fucose protein O-fucosyltransferase